MADTGHASIVIAATPTKVYELISDVTRTGEWSPECVRVDRVDATHFPRWGYPLAPTSSGETELTEWYERVAKVPLAARIIERLVMGGRQKHNDENIRASLARIKAILEA